MIYQQSQIKKKMKKIILSIIIVFLTYSILTCQERIGEVVKGASVLTNGSDDATDPALYEVTNGQAALYFNNSLKTIRLWDGISWKNLGADNLGNHTATQNLDLSIFDLIGDSGVKIGRDSNNAIIFNDGTGIGSDPSTYFDNLTFSNVLGSYVFKRANYGIRIEQDNFAVVLNQGQSNLTSDKI